MFKDPDPVPINIKILSYLNIKILECSPPGVFWFLIIFIRWTHPHFFAENR